MMLRKVKILAPVIFWIFYLLVHMIRSLYQIINGQFWQTVKVILYTNGLDAVTFVLFYLYFAPRFFAKQRLLLNILLAVLYLIIYSFVWVTVYYFWQTTDYKALKIIYFSSYGHTILFAFFGVMVRIGLEWFEKREKTMELEKQNVKTELALLRAQINPHFLFNTLNNIHSFALKSPEKTSYAIIKLSDIMRYMLYDANVDQVLLEKEIQYIRNYIDLQKLRYRNENFIEFRTEGDVSGIYIAPMLFIPFIENAFKHGKKNENDLISIYILAKKERIVFECSNTKRILNETEKSIASGIGIRNIQRRLDLLYPNKYNLTIRDENNRFNVYMVVETSDTN